MKSFKEWRKAQGIQAKTIELHATTIKRIESGSEKITLEHYRTYLQAVGLRLVVALPEE